MEVTADCSFSSCSFMFCSSEETDLWLLSTATCNSFTWAEGPQTGGLMVMWGWHPHCSVSSMISSAWYTFTVIANMAMKTKRVILTQHESIFRQTYRSNNVSVCTVLYFQTTRYNGWASQTQWRWQTQVWLVVSFAGSAAHAHGESMTSGKTSREKKTRGKGSLWWPLIEVGFGIFSLLNLHTKQNAGKTITHNVIIMFLDLHTKQNTE